MNDIERMKKDLIKTLEEIDKEKLSLPDLQLYANIVKTVSEIQAKSYLEQMSAVMATGVCQGFKQETIGTLKGGE